MKKQILSLVLCFCMVLTLLPTMVWAADCPDGWPSDTSSLQEGDKVTIDGTDYIYKSDVSTSGLNISTVPTQPTCYKAEDGYALFIPASGETPATLILHNASINNATELNNNILGSENCGICLPQGAINIQVEETNQIICVYGLGMGYMDNQVTLSGNGTLTVDGKEGDIRLDYGAFSFANGANVTLNGRVSLANLNQSGNLQFLNTFYGDVTVKPSGVQSGLELSGDVTIAQDANLTIPNGQTLFLESTTSIVKNGTITNNGTICLPAGTTAAQIKTMKMIGSGVVEVNGQYYTNDGVVEKVITGDLDLTQGDHQNKTFDNDGYTFSNNTLTLGNTHILGSVILPSGATINSMGMSVIDGYISQNSGYALNITFKGTAPLTLNSGINGGIDGDTIIIKDGANVTVNGSIFLGASGGTNGTLNVIGTGTTLNVASIMGYAVMCDAVNVQNGASMTVKTQGPHSIGVEALSGVNITGGATLTAGCDYGVYIIGGKLTMDENSKLITNASVAPFCIIDTTSGKPQGEALTLPGIPSGTQITSVKGTTDFNGGNYTYWSLVPTNGKLGVSDENSTPVTLTGAVSGQLSFVNPTASSNNSGGGSGGSSGGSSSSTSYTLSFETNGGTKISNVSKESGAEIELASYKSTRDGYSFDGWYGNKALTEKITSVKLTKNTTVYAKWTAKTAKIVNPFADVPQNAYYHDSVLWAVEKNVTSGTSNTAFNPDIICTRAQMVTFLWRAMGSPEPTAANCPFTDVSKNAYYYKAVLWAVEKDITQGASQTTFSPNATISRGQSVTFMWRAAGKPSATSANPFADVSMDAYYYNAVLWASQKGITQGISSTSFNHNMPCTRAQIVTFLYRYKGN